MPYFQKNIVTFAARNSARVILKRLVQHRVTINTLLYIMRKKSIKALLFALLSMPNVVQGQTQITLDQLYSLAD